MRILVLLQNRYYKVSFDTAIDHNLHEVYYAGTREYLEQIPQGLRCSTFPLAPDDDVDRCLEHWMQSQPAFDRIVTRQENLLMTAARLRERFGITGMLTEQTLLFRDKDKMKAAILHAGLRAPRYEVIRTPLASLPWSGKTVLKPVDGSGSRGILVFASADEALRHIHAEIASRPQHPYLGHYEAEEFVSGPIWHIDGYVFQGQAVATMASRYVGTCLDYERGRPLGSIQRDDSQLVDWALRCLQALGAHTLTFHLEAIKSENGPVFLEAAGRAGGSEIVETFRRATGIHLHALDIASDIAGKIATPATNISAPTRKYGFFLIPGHRFNGAPCTVSGADHLLADPIVETFHLLPHGAPTPKHVTYQALDVPLSGIVSAPDPDKLEDWMHALFARTRVKPHCPPVQEGMAL